MSDTYQAVYDAVRSRIGNADIGQAVQSAFRDLGIGEQAWQVSRAIQDAAQTVTECMIEPHVLMRPAIYPDGNQWCALYGSNLQEGVCGFGDSPAEAMADFNKSWSAKLQSQPQQVTKGNS